MPTNKIQMPLAVTLKTLREELLDNISYETASKIVTFAEAECDLGTKRGARVLVSKVDEALRFCCNPNNRGAMHNYKTITEARQALKEKL